MKSSYCLIFFLFMSTLLYGQQYQLSFQVGHQFGFRPQLSNDVDLSNKVKYSLGNGVNSLLMFSFIPDSANWYISLGLNSLRGNTVLVSENYRNTHQYEAVSKSISTHRFQALLNYRFKLKKSTINAYSGIVVPFYNRIVEEYSMKDSFLYVNKSYKVRNYLSIGYHGGLEYQKRINSKLSFSLSSNLTVLNQRVKSKNMINYADHNLNTIDFIPDRANREFQYKKDVIEIQNNESFLPRAFNKNSPTDLLTYTETLSSVGISIGVVYHF